MKRSNSKDMVVNTHFGKLFIRKNTVDFKMASKTYEKAVYKLFLKELHKADVVIDIGANIGLYSIVAAKNNIPTIAFEPIEENIKALQENIKINDVEDKVTVYPYALGDEEEEIDFNYNSYNTGATSKYKTYLKTTSKKAVIKEFDKLDLPQLKKVSSVLFIIDVEGMEVNVIKGMQNFIKSIKELGIIVESKHVGISEIKSILNQLGNFEYKRIDPFNLYAKKIN